MLKTTSLIIVFLLISSPLFAEKIYKWRDKSGQLHFSNTAPSIPIDENDLTIHEMVSSSSPTEEEEEEPVSIDIGKVIWENTCSTCHIMNSDGSKEKRGIRTLLTGLEKVPPEKALAIQALNNAVEDEMDDAIKLELSTEEIASVVEFIYLTKDKYTAPKAPVPNIKINNE